MSKRPSEKEEERGAEKKSRMEDETMSDQVDGIKSDQVDQTMSDKVDETPSDQADQTMSDQTEGKPSDQVDQTMSDKVDETPSDQADETMSDQTEGKPSDQADETMSDQREDKPSDQADQTMSDQTEDKPSDQTMSDQTEDKTSDQADQTMSDQVDDTPSDQKDQTMSDKVDDAPSDQQTSKSTSATANRSELDRWSGRVALVTGASSGIGATLCRTLVQHGMKVVGCSRNVDRIKAIGEEVAVKESPGQLTAIKCDLTKESDILATFDEIRKTFGRLDICINNAGLGHDAPLISGKTSEFKNMLDVNVLALAICTREAVKLMEEKAVDDGQIIHISSVGGHFLPAGSPGASFYCGTKFMVRALTEGLRKELKDLKSHIRVASVSPGMVQTEFFDNYFKNNAHIKPADIYQNYPPLQPKDIAESVLYILSAPRNAEVHDIIIRPYVS